MKNKSFASEFMKSKDIKPGIYACEADYSIAGRARQGDNTVIENLKKAIYDGDEDWNIRGSCLATLYKAFKEERYKELIPIFNDILNEDGADPEIHRTIFYIFSESNGHFRELLREIVCQAEMYDDHRGKFAREALDEDDDE